MAVERPELGRACAYGLKVNPGYHQRAGRPAVDRMIQVMALNTVRRHCGFRLPPGQHMISPISNPIHTMMAT